MSEDNKKVIKIEELLTVMYMFKQDLKASSAKEYVENYFNTLEDIKRYIDEHNGTNEIHCTLIGPDYE